MVLIEDIFSFQTNVYYPRNSTDWNLRTIAKEMNLNEFNSIFEFLKTNGVLMQLIRHLMADPNIRYDFPITCLPVIFLSTTFNNNSLLICLFRFH